MNYILARNKLCTSNPRGHPDPNNVYRNEKGSQSLPLQNAVRLQLQNNKNTIKVLDLI